MADFPFRRAKFKYSVEQVSVTIKFYGSELDGISFSDPIIVKKYAKHVKLGEIFKFDRAILKSDSVFHNSPRGWFSFIHTTFVLFFFGYMAWCQNFIQRCFCRY